MLSTMRQSWLLFTLLALIAFSSALSIEEALHVDGIEGYFHPGHKRQVQGTGSSASPDPSSSDAPSPSPSSTPQDSPTPTPTASEDDPSSNAPQSTNAPAPSPSTTPSGGSRQTTTSSNSPNSPAETGKDVTSTKTSTPSLRTTPLVATSVREYTTIITTKSNGQDVAVTSTGSSTDLITTGQAVETGLPGTQNGGSDGGGLTDNNKKIIGGVVGGIGGAILLGGIAIVCWRMWGRKNRVAEDDADLMANTGAALGDKPQNGPTPFQSNLEQYHNPGGRPNKAANF